MADMEIVRSVAAEFIGTTLFVWCGCGSAVAAQAFGSSTSGGTLVAIALGFGFAISSLAYAIGPISGGHMNPAVSFSFALLGKLNWVVTTYYIVAQCAGAIFGAAMLYASVYSATDDCVVGDTSFICVKTPQISEGVWGPPFGLGANVANDTLSGFIIEAMGTALLIFVIFMTADSPRGSKNSKNAAPIAIGWAVMLAHLVMVPFTGCGINPARVLGPLVVDSCAGINCWNKHSWVFFVAPFVGSLVTIIAYKGLFQDKEPKGESETDDEEKGE